MSGLPVAGFVLAGGRSSRMGRDKVLLEFGGELLIERALKKLRAVCASVAIAGGGEELTAFGQVVPDEVPGCGPLGGIVAALETSEFEWGLFLPVDVPLVPMSFVLGLAGRCLASDAVAVMPRVKGRVEPLCAGYSRKALAGLREELAGGRLKVTEAVRSTGRVEYFDAEEAPERFANVNTPEEFALALEYVSAMGG